MKCFLKIFDVYKCFFICVCLLYVFGTAEPAAGDACELPDGARGECVPLPACAQYVALLKETTTTELGLKLTQERRCGIEGNNPKVCCPTETEVPNVKVRTNLSESDFVDELPEPGRCGRKPIESSPYVWNGKPVKTRADKTLNTRNRVIGSSYSFAASSIPEYPPFSVAGGLPLITREKAQWMALLAYKRSPSTWECGGSIITKRHVLTAAHCIRESLYVVRVGELDLAVTKKEFEPLDFYIKKKIRHEQYTKYHNDIAILVLEGTIPIDDPYSFRYIAPVCLPESGFPYEKQGPQSTFITGWGETEKNGERPTNLLYAYLDIVDQDTCKSVYKNEALTIDERVFCAGDPNNGRDACNGDSGGPLIARYYLPDYHGVFHYQVGLISYGYRCSAQRFTGVYTNITHFMPWILEKVTGRPEPRQWTKTTMAPLFPFFSQNKSISSY